MTDAPKSQISNLTAIQKFITAGNAIFTLVSKKTGDRKTFLVEKAPEKTGSPGFFVRLLIGPENSSNYRYLGFMFDHHGLRISINKQKWGQEAHLAFWWLLNMINRN